MPPRTDSDDCDDGDDAESCGTASSSQIEKNGKPIEACGNDDDDDDDRAGSYRDAEPNEVRAGDEIVIRSVAAIGDGSVVQSIKQTFYLFWVLNRVPIGLRSGNGNSFDSGALSCSVSLEFGE